MLTDKPRIDSAVLKAKWAEVHLDNLRDGIRHFVDMEMKQPTSEDDLQRGEHVITLWHTNPPPEIALLMGDFVCCLRSSLEHLAYQLARIDGKPNRETCFPIRHEDTIEAQDAITKATLGFPKEAITIVRNLQPYHHPNSYKTLHLWRLHKMWNIDKHRFIAMHSTALDWQIPVHLMQPIVERFDDHVKMRFPIAVKQQMHLYPRPTVDIRFGDDGEGIILAHRDFREMHEYIANGVIPMFKSYFPK